VYGLVNRCLENEAIDINTQSAAGKSVRNRMGCIWYSEWHKSAVRPSIMVNEDTIRENFQVLAFMEALVSNVKLHRQFQQEVLPGIITEAFYACG
jgi:hypothetical protein